jgi:hypothetical protein
MSKKKSVFGPEGHWTSEASDIEYVIRPFCKEALLQCKEAGYGIRVAMLVAGLAVLPQEQFGLDIDVLEFKSIWMQTVNDIGLEIILTRQGF